MSWKEESILLKVEIEKELINKESQLVGKVNYFYTWNRKKYLQD
jgi:hypothetical protein